MTTQPICLEDTPDELSAVVARIRARGAGTGAPSPSPSAVAAAIRHLKGEKPLSAAELAVREQEWLAAEAEMRAIEAADSRAERRLSAMI